MKHPRFARSYIRACVIGYVILLILLGLFQSIWVIGGSETAIMTQIGLQRTREQLIVKDAGKIASRTATAAEQSQALSELQTTLPLFEATQQGLRTGSAALKLPVHVPENIAIFLATAQSDYMQIDAAARVIIAHHNPVDMLEVEAIQSHESNYLMTMGRVSDLWQMRIDNAFLQIFGIEASLVAILLGFIVANYLFVIRRAFNQLVELVEAEEARQKTAKEQQALE